MRIRSSSLVSSVWILCGLSIFAGSVLGQSTATNVVLIISDDQAWTDYGFMGHSHIQTPHLDRLAQESLTFTRGYVPSSLCRPSLASIITGLYPHQHRLAGNDPSPVRDGGTNPAKLNAARRAELIDHIDQVPTLPRLLAERGYVSFQSGKWWEGNFRRGGFTEGMTRGFPERGWSPRGRWTGDRTHWPGADFRFYSPSQRKRESRSSSGMLRFCPIRLTHPQHACWKSTSRSRILKTDRQVLGDVRMVRRNVRTAARVPR